MLYLLVESEGSISVQVARLEGAGRCNAVIDGQSGSMSPHLRRWSLTSFELIFQIDMQLQSTQWQNTYRHIYIGMFRCIKMYIENAEGETPPPLAIGILCQGLWDIEV